MWASGFGLKKLCHNFYKQPFVKHGKRTYMLVIYMLCEFGIISYMYIGVFCNFYI